MAMLSLNNEVFRKRNFPPVAINDNIQLEQQRKFVGYLFINNTGFIKN